MKTEKDIKRMINTIRAKIDGNEEALKGKLSKSDRGYILNEIEIMREKERVLNWVLSNE